MEQVVKTGTIYKLHKGVMKRGDTWKKCTAKVIETDNDGLLKLESDSERAHSFSLQLCSQVQDPGPKLGRSHTVELLLQRKSLLLGFDTAEEALEWRTVISRYSKDSFSRIDAPPLGNHARQPPPPRRAPADPGPQVVHNDSMEYNVAYELDATIPPLEVEVRPSPLSKQLGLHGKLHLIIEDDKLSVRFAECKDVAFSWEYRTIRKYGRDRHSFSMEVGRRSPTGPGVLVFMTGYGNDIFQRVQRNTIAINTRPAATSQASAPKGKGSPRGELGTGKGRGVGQEAGMKNSTPQHVARIPSPPPESSEYSTIEDSRRSHSRGVRNAKEVEYSKAEELKEDAWRTHGRLEDNIHREFYVGLEKPDQKLRPSKPPRPAGAGTNRPPPSDIYGKVNRNPAGGRRGDQKPAPLGDTGVYSSLDSETRPHALPPPPAESEYDSLARPMEQIPMLNPGDKQTVSGGNGDYDCLARGAAPPPAEGPPGGEGVYNVIERPLSSGSGRMVNLIDDGSGYMTNAGGMIPPENEYDTADIV